MFRHGRLSPTGETCGEYAMGSVADKIAGKIVSSRGSKVVDLAGCQEGRTVALEAGLGDDLAPGAGHDPCHALYVVAQNVASLMAESIAGMREAKGYVRIVEGAENEYLRGGPPMSPLTVRYFTMWGLFDVWFGSSRETMGSCILRIAPEFDCPSWLIDPVAGWDFTCIAAARARSSCCARSARGRSFSARRRPAMPAVKGRSGSCACLHRPTACAAGISCSTRTTSSGTIPNAPSSTIRSVARADEGEETAPDR